MAAMPAGGVGDGFPPTPSPGALRYPLQHGEAALFVAGDLEHLERAPAVLADRPRLRRLPVADARAPFMSRDGRKEEHR
jgi:hypothetical protein